MKDLLKIHGDGPVVLVEDDYAAAHLMRRCYERSALKNEFVWLSSGLALMEHLRAVGSGAARMPALILLDLHMPGLDGVRTLTINASAGSADRPPVVMLTDARDPRHREKAERLHADAVRMKAEDPADTIEYFNSLAA